MGVDKEKIVEGRGQQRISAHWRGTKRGRDKEDGDKAGGTRETN